MTPIVYVLERRDGTALYVGATRDPERRLATHRASRDWWNEVYEVRRIDCASDAQAERIERELIQDLRPTHNVLRPLPGTRALRAGLAVLSMRVDRTKLDALRTIAEANRRSVSGHLRWLIDKAIAEHENGVAA